ncbi:hypothetical protein H105_03498 [Trichophyton soudanense CBS 452.61]|uniref:Scaffold protein Nfu/NifU N-terminal domain-containing protein n=1 Tax=Trichophyton soudanense CBS 452.61 TaxID=1215331 RepID=A0A022XWB5_TRISD|nr:hypothetical protein H105_03498 [Trichophyton soudanense CBS 452.61]
MASQPLSRVLSRTVSSPLSALRRQSPQLSLRWLSSASRPPMVVLAHHRPTLQRHHQPVTQGRTGVPSNRRTIFIETDTTPNADALKFRPNHPVLPEGFPVSFLEYLTPRSTLQPPYPSPLAAKLLNVDGAVSVFFGSDFITVTKDSDANWAHIKPEIFSLITEAITRGEALVNVIDVRQGKEGAEGAEAEEAVRYNEEDEEVVGMIQELLETRIRPAIQEDGGDIEFRGFENGNVLLKLRGACRTCDSSTVTLKNGIESMLMHYVSSPPLFIHAPAPTPTAGMLSPRC